MLASVMLSIIRTWIDEDTAEFVLDSEIYQALSDGQREYASIVFAQFKKMQEIDRNAPLPFILLPLFAEYENGYESQTALTMPANFWDVIYLTYGNTPPYTPLYKRELSAAREFLKNNSLMNAASTYFGVTATAITLETASPATPTNFQLGYLSIPQAIDGATEPVLPEVTHEAICKFALAEILKKSKQFQPAIAAFNEFIQEIKYY